MDEEMKTLMRRNIELTRENNKLLKKIRRNGIIANIMRLVWWGIIIGVPLALYYYVLQPYIAELASVYQGVTEGAGNAQTNLLDLPIIGDLVKTYLGNP